jgi:hypothetical protein
LSLERGTLQSFGFQKGFHKVSVLQCKRRHWSSLPCKLSRVLKRAFQDEPRDRIEINGGDIATKPHGFKGDSTAACERIENFGWMTTVRITDFLAEPIEIRARLPTPM